RRVAAELFAAGASAVLAGEPELAARAYLEKPEAREGLVFSGPEPDLETLPAPAWDLLPASRYWDLRHSHRPTPAPLFPIMPSRGCPYRCAFCVSPETTGARWRGRSPKSVADEMDLLGERFGVREFHVVDLNPTVSEERVRALCEELIRRDLRVSWKISA